MTKGRGGGLTPSKVVELLNMAIQEKGQSRLEQEIGLSHSMISRYKRGVGEPSKATLEKLANYFEVSVAELRGEGFIPETLISDGVDIFSKIHWPESTGVYEKHLWLLTHEFLLALDDTGGYDNNPLLIRTTYLKALNVLEWDSDFYNNLDKNSEVYIKLREHVATVFDSLKSDFGFVLNTSLDIQAYFQIFAQGVIKKYLAILETRESALIKDFSILFKSTFTKEETEIFKRKSAEAKLNE